MWFFHKYTGCKREMKQVFDLILEIQKCVWWGKNGNFNVLVFYVQKTLRVGVMVTASRRSRKEWLAPWIHLSTAISKTISTTLVIDENFDRRDFLDGVPARCNWGGPHLSQLIRISWRVIILYTYIHILVVTSMNWMSYRRYKIVESC